MRSDREHKRGFGAAAAGISDFLDDHEGLITAIQALRKHTLHVSAPLPKVHVGARPPLAAMGKSCRGR
jgi:hypothetical protein